MYAFGLNTVTRFFFPWRPRPTAFIGFSRVSETQQRWPSWDSRPKEKGADVLAQLQPDRRRGGGGGGVSAETGAPAPRCPSVGVSATPPSTCELQGFALGPVAVLTPSPRLLPWDEDHFMARPGSVLQLLVSGASSSALTVSRYFEQKTLSFWSCPR